MTLLQRSGFSARLRGSNLGDESHPHERGVAERDTESEREAGGRVGTRGLSGPERDRVARSRKFESRATILITSFRAAETNGARHAGT